MHREFTETFRGTEIYNDPVNGETVELSNTTGMPGNWTTVPIS